MTIELYHSQSSTCAQKVRLALAEKRLPWLSHHLNLARFDQLAPEFLALNPRGMVPVLVHEGMVLTESMVISEYLDEAFPAHPLMPAEPRRRARVRWWTKYVSDVATGAIKIPSFNVRLKPVAQGYDTATLELIESRMPDREAAARWLRIARGGHTRAEIEASLAQLAEMLDRMESALTGSAWLADDMLTLADLDMLPFAHRLVEIGEERMLRTRPQVSRWYDALAARPSFGPGIGLAESGPVTPPDEAA